MILPEKILKISWTELVSNGEILIKIGTIKKLLLTKKETDEISVTHNEDRRHRESNTHLLKEREAGESKQFNELLSEWMTEQR